MVGISELGNFGGVLIRDWETELGWMPEPGSNAANKTTNKPHNLQLVSRDQTSVNETVAAIACSEPPEGSLSLNLRLPNPLDLEVSFLQTLSVVRTKHLKRSPCFILSSSHPILKSFLPLLTLLFISQILGYYHHNQAKICLDGFTAGVSKHILHYVNDHFDVGSTDERTLIRHPDYLGRIQIRTVVERTAQGVWQRQILVHVEGLIGGELKDEEEILGRMNESENANSPVKLPQTSKRDAPEIANKEKLNSTYRCKRPWPPDSYPISFPLPNLFTVAVSRYSQTRVLAGLGWLLCFLLLPKLFKY